MAKGKVIHAQDACIVLVEGNPRKRLEPSEHRIEFPGGSIGVTRTSDQEYWAHIIVNDGEVDPDIHPQARKGEMVDSRVDYHVPLDIQEIADIDEVSHIGVRIRTHYEQAT